MSKVSGASILLYANGTLIALQRDLSLELERDLMDATNKESSGWKEHEKGEKSVSVPFEALISTTGMSASELFAFIISGTQSILLVINGFEYPFVMEVDLKSSSIKAPHGDLAALSGTFVAKGAIYYLSGANANLVTDPDGGTTDYDTLTHSGIKITSAVNAAGSAYVQSNAFGVNLADVIKLFVYMTKTSGQLPSVGIWDNTSAFISNTEALVEGFNLVTLTVTGTDASASLRFTNSAAASWNSSNIYCFKTA